MTRFARRGTYELLLEAEVAPGQQAKFQRRYLAATSIAVLPGAPTYYQNQPGKWGAELRVYFNDPGMAAALAANGMHVEYPRKGYKAGEYRYRLNDNTLWWKLVEEYGFRLGPN